jgi:hypothetical protein
MMRMSRPAFSVASSMRDKLTVTSCPSATSSVASLV